MSDTTDTGTFTGWCCVDCLMLLANGEVPPDWSDLGVSDWLLSIEQNTSGYSVTLGAMFGVIDGCEHTGPDDYERHAEECERVTFSSTSCDVCGSRLAGAREAVTFWPSDN